MNLIDIVKNAPEGAQRYKVFKRLYDDFIGYYALIDGVEKFYLNSEKDWKEGYNGHFSNSLPLPKLETSYKKVEDSIWDLKEEFEMGDLYCQLIGDSGEYRVIEEEDSLISEMSDSNVYRRIDKIIDEREEFAKKYMTMSREFIDLEGDLDWPDFLYSKGCRFID